MCVNNDHVMGSFVSSEERSTEVLGRVQMRRPNDCGKADRGQMRLAKVDERGREKTISKKLWKAPGTGGWGGGSLDEESVIQPCMLCSFRKSRCF